MGHQEAFFYLEGNDVDVPILSVFKMHLKNTLSNMLELSVSPPLVRHSH